MGVRGLRLSGRPQVPICSCYPLKATSLHLDKPSPAASSHPALLYHRCELNLEAGSTKVKFTSNTPADLGQVTLSPDCQVPTEQHPVPSRDGGRVHRGCCEPSAGSPASRGAPGPPQPGGSPAATPCYVLSQECSEDLASRSSEPLPELPGCIRQVPVVITTRWLSAAWARGPRGCCRRLTAGACSPLNGLGCFSGEGFQPLPLDSSAPPSHLLS